MKLYETKEIETYRRKKQTAGIVTAVLGAVILGVCIYICALVTPYNAAYWEKVVIGIFVIGGWTIIYLLVEVVLMAKREEGHTRLILEGEEETFRGRVEVRKEIFHIPQSITIRKIFLHESDEKGSSVIKLNIDVRREKEILKLDGKKAVLTASHGYIIAGEETE